VFSDLLTPQIRAGKKIIDPTRFLVDRTQSRKHPELCYATVRLPWLASEYFNADLLLASVQTEHQAYCGVFSGTGAFASPDTILRSSNPSR
jgi:hypothetical protein